MQIEGSDVAFFSRGFFRPLHACFQKNCKHVDNPTFSKTVSAKTQATAPSPQDTKPAEQMIVEQDEEEEDASIVVPPTIFSYTIEPPEDSRDDSRDDMESMVSEISLPNVFMVHENGPVDLDLLEDTGEVLVIPANQVNPPSLLASQRTWPDDESSSIITPPTPEQLNAIGCMPAPLDDELAPEKVEMKKISSIDAVRPNSRSTGNRPSSDQRQDEEEEESLAKKISFPFPSAEEAGPASRTVNSKDKRTRVNGIHIFMNANGEFQRVIYSGDINNDTGLPHGTGVVKFPNGDMYLGDMRDGQMNGHGTLVFAADHDFVTGDFENNMYVI